MIKVGKMTITASCGNIKATCEVNVLPIVAEKIVLSKEKISIHELDSIKITANIFPENTTDKTITLSSSNKNIVYVSQDGLIKAVKVGNVIITAECGKIKTTCEINVVPPDSIILDYEKIALNESDSIKISAKVSLNISSENSTKVTWSSSDLKVATVSDEGIVKAIGAGKATITATCGEISATCEVTVYEDTNINVNFIDNKLTVAVEGVDTNASIKIYTAFGQCVYDKSFKKDIVFNDEINLSNYSSGTYIVLVVSGKKRISKRIVK